MPFELGGAINQAAERLCASSAMQWTFNNPFFTALLLTAVVMAIVYAVGTHQRAGVRCSFYVFLFSSLILFVHYYVARGMFCRTADAELRRSVVGGAHDGFRAADKSHGLRWSEGSFRQEYPKLVSEPCGCEDQLNEAKAPFTASESGADG